MKKIILIVVVAVLVVLMGWKLFSNKKTIDAQGKPKEDKNIVIPVNVTTITSQTLSDSLIKVGTLVPVREADITPVIGGKLVTLNFNLGSYVSKGQVIASLDKGTLEIQLKQAKLTLEKAERDFKRQGALLEGNATTAVSVQDAEYSMKNAQNQIQLLQKQISDNNIVAPISGQVVTKVKEAGEFISPGVALGHIVDVSSLKANVYVGEKDVYALNKGARVKVSTDIYPGQEFSGTISFISQKGDATHNYQVEITLPNHSNHALKAGTFVNVDFSRKSAQSAIIIPSVALIDGTLNPKVYVVQNGKAVVKSITIGGELAGGFEVLSGLETNDQVVIAGQINLSNGSSVKIISGKE